MAGSPLTSNMTVAEVLESWPETVPVFQKLKTDCVGCAMAPFDTLSDVAQIYEINLPKMLEALSEAIRGSKDGEDGS